MSARPVPSGNVTIAAPADARRQAAWLVAMEPWRSLGYAQLTLGRWLGGEAARGRVLLWRESPRRAPSAVIVFQPDVLLGWFVSLLAVRPAASGRGIGRALLEHVARDCFRARRWLYVSCDESNQPARAFYRKLGFARVGRLPELIAPGRAELLLRLGRDRSIGAPKRRALDRERPGKR